MVIMNGLIELRLLLWWQRLAMLNCWLLLQWWRRTMLRRCLLHQLRSSLSIVRKGRSSLRLIVLYLRQRQYWHLLRWLVRAPLIRCRVRCRLTWILI